jgi:hypothetical protein
MPFSHQVLHGLAYFEIGRRSEAGCVVRPHPCDKISTLSDVEGYFSPFFDKEENINNARGRYRRMKRNLGDEICGPHDPSLAQNANKSCKIRCKTFH